MRKTIRLCTALLSALALLAGGFALGTNARAADERADVYKIETIGSGSLTVNESVSGGTVYFECKTDTLLKAPQSVGFAFTATDGEAEMTEAAQAAGLVFGREAANGNRAFTDFLSEEKYMRAAFNLDAGTFTLSARYADEQYAVLAEKTGLTFPESGFPGVIFQGDATLYVQSYGFYTAAADNPLAAEARTLSMAQVAAQALESDRVAVTPADGAGYVANAVGMSLTENYYAQIDFAVEGNPSGEYIGFGLGANPAGASLDAGGVSVRYSAAGTKVYVDGAEATGVQISAGLTLAGTFADGAVLRADFKPNDGQYKLYRYDGGVYTAVQTITGLTLPRGGLFAGVQFGAGTALSGSIGLTRVAISDRGGTPLGYQTNNVRKTGDPASASGGAITRDGYLTSDKAVTLADGDSLVMQFDVRGSNRNGEWVGFALAQNLADTFLQNGAGGQLVFYNDHTHTTGGATFDEDHSFGEVFYNNNTLRLELDSDFKLTISQKASTAPRFNTIQTVQFSKLPQVFLGIQTSNVGCSVSMKNLTIEHVHEQVSETIESFSIVRAEGEAETTRLFGSGTMSSAGSVIGSGQAIGVEFTVDMADRGARIGFSMGYASSGRLEDGRKGNGVEILDTGTKLTVAGGGSPEYYHVWHVNRTAGELFTPGRRLRAEFIHLDDDKGTFELFRMEADGWKLMQKVTGMNFEESGSDKPAYVGVTFENHDGSVLKDARFYTLDQTDATIACDAAGTAAVELDAAPVLSRVEAVSADQAAGTVAALEKEMYTAGAELTLEAEAKEGWAFGYWTDRLGNKISGEPVFTTVVPEHDETYTALFLPARKLTVINGVNGSKTEYAVAVGKKVTVAAAAPDGGFAFDCWMKGDTLLSEGKEGTCSFTMPDNDVTVRAVYAPAPASQTIPFGTGEDPADKKWVTVTIAVVCVAVVTAGLIVGMVFLKKKLGKKQGESK